MARDNVSEEQVKARIDAQLPEAEKVKLADYVIDNNLIMELVPQVSKVHLDLLNAQ
jgi:dephospho-CoA kinase